MQLSAGRLKSFSIRMAFCAAALASHAAGAMVVHYPGGTSYAPIYSSANIVVNSDFNLDPLVDPLNPFVANPNITGWTVSPVREFTGTRNSNAGVGADGRGLRLGSIELTDVSQVLPTAAGQRYQLSFFLAVDDTNVGNLLRVFVGDQLIANLDNTPTASNDEGWFWQYIYGFEATSSSTALDFQYASPHVDQHLSNVTVLAAVPEPASWALMLAGAAVVVGVARRPRAPAGRGASLA